MKDAPSTPQRIAEGLRARLPVALAPLAADLGAHLEPLLAADGHRARVTALIGLAAWTMVAEGDGVGVLPPELTGGWQAAGVTVSRLQVLVTVLELDADLRDQVARAFAATLAGLQGMGFYGDSGIPGRRGFLAQAVGILHARLLPHGRDDGDLASVIARLLRSDGAVAAFQRIPPEVFARLAAALLPVGAPEGVSLGFGDGFRLLAARVVSETSPPGFRRRLPACHLPESPFYRQWLAGERLVAAWSAGNLSEADVATWRAAIAGCHDQLALVRAGLGAEGISVDLIYGLDAIGRCLRRMELMVGIMTAPVGAARWDGIRRLVARVAGYVHHDRSLRKLARDNLTLLHRRIVERSAGTGEHYIAHDGASYRHIWIASTGGGLLTVGTAAAKVALAAVHGTAFLHGLLYGLNYAASFICLQHLGLMLATKQPAMTAAVVAQAMGREAAEDRQKELEALCARICASQVASALANVITVAVGAFAFDALVRLVTGRHWIPEEQARALYADLSPLDSMTVLYSIETGVILWASSLVGGWLDNWNSYHGLARGLRERGGRWSGRLGTAIDRHLSGWGTNVALGMMLGFAPIVGDFFGILVDVRHVTLSSGLLALATCGLGESWWNHGAILWAIAGVATMFVLNLGVSFGLSLATAASAHGLLGREVLGLLGALLRALVRRPLAFLIPRWK